MQTPRGHKSTLGTSFDTLASHSYHVSVIAYCLSRMEGLDQEGATKAVTMAVFHDLAEARTGDQTFVYKHYTKANEKKAVADQFANLRFGKDLENLIKEYEDHETLVAKCAKDADSLAQIYHEWVLMWQGNKLAEKWFENDFKNRVPVLKTESAKKLAFSMKESNPHEWWWIEFTKNGRPKDIKKLLGKK